MDTAQFIEISTLTFDPKLQVRVRIDEDRIAQYSESMATEEEMQSFPPAVIFYDGVKYWLADGHHRRAAAEKAGHKKIWAVVKSGTIDDAIVEAISANWKQGCGLTRADRRRALEIAITAWPEKSTTVIAETIGCPQSTIDRIKRELTQMGKLTLPEKTVGKDGKSRPAQQKTSKQTSNGELDTSEESVVLKVNTKEAGTDSVPNDNGDYYPPLSQPIPEKYSQFEQSVKLQNISLKNPEGLIACLFDLFERPYREKLVLELIGKMETDDGKKTVQRIMMKLNKKFPN